MNPEVCYLKAQVWSLVNQLKEEEKGKTLLQRNITNAFKEKYELIEELNLQNQLNLKITKQLEQERYVKNLKFCILSVF